jgi:hypothetical protein
MPYTQIPLDSQRPTTLSDAKKQQLNKNLKIKTCLLNVEICNVSDLNSYDRISS